MNYKDLKGQRVGTLTIIDDCYVNGRHGWQCKCDCGNTVYRITSSLRDSINNNVFTTCGCIHKNIDGKEQTVVGHSFKGLKIISYNDEKREYICEDIKNKKIILSPKKLSLRLTRYFANYDDMIEKQNFLAKYDCPTQEEFTKKSVRLHHALTLIKIRCYDKKSWAYQYYGARGIKVCQEWLENAKTFVYWSLENGYAKGLQIDRIDNNGDYCPENCRWVSRTENANNKRNNVYIEYNGKTQTLSQWCREYNISYKYTHYLIKYKNYTLDNCIKKLSSNK